MEVVGGVFIFVAVADERVTTAAALATEGYGSVILQLAVDEVHPRLIAVVFAVAVLYAAIVAKYGLQCVGNGLAIG